MNQKAAAPLTHDLLARKGEATAAQWQNERDGTNSREEPALNPEPQPQDATNNARGGTRSIVIDRRFITVALTIGIVSGLASYFLFARPAQETSRVAISTPATPAPANQGGMQDKPAGSAEVKSSAFEATGTAEPEQGSLLPASGPQNTTPVAPSPSMEATKFQKPFPKIQPASIATGSPALSRSEASAPLNTKVEKPAVLAAPAPPPVVVPIKKLDKPAPNTPKQAEQQKSRTISEASVQIDNDASQVAIAIPNGTATNAVATAKKTNSVSAARKPAFTIQLASVKNRQAADRESLRLKKQHPDTLGNVDVSIEKANITNRGTFFRIKAGRFQSAREAATICKALKAKKQPCLVVRH